MSDMALSIEAIDEQNIPIGTTDYMLEIDIGGEPDRAYVDGAMEGFYQSYDAANAKLKIISDRVTRLLQGSIWNVHLVKGAETLDNEIIYNVVPRAPIIIDPGPQDLWKGELFKLLIRINNEPSVARSNALLVGVKEITEGTGLYLEGKLPIDAILTESGFDAEIYAETEGGTDMLSVPFTIKTHTGVYVFDEGRTLRKIGPDAATLDWTYQAPEVVDDPNSLLPGTLRYESINVTPNGIILFSNVNNHLLKVSPDGGLIWTFPEATDGNYNKTATLRGIYLYRSGVIYQINEKTGELILAIETEYDDLLFFDSNLYLINDTTLVKLNEFGETAWTYEAPAGSYRAPAAGGDGIYLYQQNGQIRKINIADGTLGWSYNPGVRDIDGLLADGSGAYVVIGSTSPRQIRKINEADGTLDWTFTANLIFNTAIYEDGIFLRSENGLVKVNLENGTEIWNSSLSRGYTGPIIQPNGIYEINNTANDIIKINRTDGSRDWAVIRSKIAASKLLVEDRDGSHFYVVAPDGSTTEVVKLMISDGSEVWRYDGTAYFNDLAIPNFSLPE